MKLVLCANIDAKPDAPGALDNAAGIVTLMLLAELLKVHQPVTGQPGYFLKSLTRSLHIILAALQHPCYTCANMVSFY